MWPDAARLLIAYSHLAVCETFIEKTKFDIYGLKEVMVFPSATCLQGKETRE